MSITFEAWRDHLVAANPKTLGDQHQVICWVRGADKSWEIKVLSKEDFTTMSKQNGWFTSVCKKLSFGEIVSISKRFIHDCSETKIFNGYSYKLSPQSYFTTKLTKIIDETNAFSSDYEENIRKELNSLKTESERMAGFAPALIQMHNRSYHKKNQERQHGVLGKIKWHIWTWFFAKNREVQGLSQAPVNFMPALKEGINTIRDRILINMQAHEEIVDELNVQLKSNPKIEFPEGFESINCDDDQKYSTPKEVRKQWILLFHPDKFKLPEISVRMNYDPKEALETSYNRVSILTKTWEMLIQIQRGEVIPEAKSLEQPLLTEN